MDKVKKYQAIIKKLLQEQANILVPTQPKIEYQIISDTENNHFQLVMTGWNEKDPTRGRTAPTSKTLQFLNIDKHRQLFYRMRGTTLVIVDIFDTRQHPSKRPK
jgi:hypothetical protein